VAPLLYVIAKIAKIGGGFLANEIQTGAYNFFSLTSLQY